MAIFKKVKTSVEFPKVEKSVLKQWEKEQTFQK